MDVTVVIKCHTYIKLQYKRKIFLLFFPGDFYIKKNLHKNGIIFIIRKVLWKIVITVILVNSLDYTYFVSEYVNYFLKVFCIAKESLHLLAQDLCIQNIFSLNFGLNLSWKWFFYSFSTLIGWVLLVFVKENIYFDNQVRIFL